MYGLETTTNMRLKSSLKTRISKIREIERYGGIEMGFFLLIVIVLGTCKLISEIFAETKVTHNVDRIVKQNAEEIKKELDSSR